MRHIFNNSKLTNIVISILVVLAISSCTPNSNNNSNNSDVDKLYKVKKSNFTIGTLLTGTVNAKKKYKLALEASINTSLNWIVDENSSVKKGDTIIKFEEEELLEQIDNIKITVDSSEKGLLIEREKKIILESENKASIREATDNVTTAEGSLSRYLKYDGRKDRRSKELSVVNAEKAYKDAKSLYLEKSDFISNKIYDEETEKDNDVKIVSDLNQKMKTAENAFKNAKLDLKIFKRYTHPNKLTLLKNTLEQTRLNLQRVKISTASSMIQKDSNIFKYEKENKKLVKDLQRYEKYLPMLEIKAPVAGIVVYGDMDRRRNKTEIKIGMDVKRKQVLATIPDMNNLIIDFEIPEQFRHRISKGASVTITPESMPSLKVKGKVSEIAIVPVNKIYWDASSPKIYKSKISINVQNKKLVSGMNVQVEVITDILQDVINIPVEAVFEEDGEYFVYKKELLKTKKQTIELGKSNENYVHVTSGLSTGDTVYLYRPFEQDSAE